MQKTTTSLISLYNFRAMFHQYLQTPFGWIKIQATKESIIEISHESKTAKTKKQNPSALTLKCEKQLKEYFTKKRLQFNLPLDYPYGTSFQKRVWDALQKIPYGGNLFLSSHCRRGYKSL